VLSGGGLGFQSIEGIIIQASSEEALEVARSLARLQGMSCGISSGCNVAARLMASRHFSRLRTIVALIPKTA
jgi:cysteine synthase A